MGISFLNWLLPKNGKTEKVNVTDIVCRELLDAALDYQIRELAWWSCVNWIADAIGRCEVRTYREGREIRDREYYMWNVEPNVNQNSTAFWHKAIARLYENNELLMIPVRRRDGYDSFVVADSWDEPEPSATRQLVYRGVTVDNFQFEKSFREDDVLHLKLNARNLKPVLDGIFSSYVRLIHAAMDASAWGSGQHWKVHVDQVAGGQNGWAETFQQMITAQIKPFMQSGGAVLPEFDGYKYEKIDGSGGKDTRDIRAMIDDIFTLTARGFELPGVLVLGEVEATGDAMRRALSFPIDTFCDAFSEEGTRKRYGFDDWKKGSYLRMDSSTIQHFSLFDQAANIEKLLGSGWSLNDIRRAAGESPIPEKWADEHFLTKNIGQIATVAAGAREGET